MLPFHDHKLTAPRREQGEAQGRGSGLLMNQAHKQPVLSSR